MGSPGAESTESQTLRRTPLYNAHARLGARFVPFGGWEMPVQYSGVIDEHTAVRERVGLFDVSHMGEVMITGPKAFEYLQFVTSNDVSKLVPGRAQYSLLLNPEGGVVDDIIVYQLEADEYLICVNAGTTAKDVRWLHDHNRVGAEVRDVSAEYTQIATQGPRAMELVSNTLLLPPETLSLGEFPSFAIKRVPHAQFRSELLVARTGYTGEDGVEIFCRADEGEKLWELLIDEGRKFDVRPCGLGARDTLRLEVCYPLYGHELRDDIDALTSGVGWVVKLAKGDFIGRAALEKRKASGGERKLVGVELRDPGILREGYNLFNDAGAAIGWVTSGTKTPTVNRAIGLAFVQKDFSAIGTQCFADVRGKLLRAEIVPTPFYKRQA